MATRRKRGGSRSGSSRRSGGGYNRNYYVKNRRKILAKARARYRKKRPQILRYQKRYRRLTKTRGPFYMQGRKTGKRPKFGRLPRVHKYSFIGRRVKKSTSKVGRQAANRRRPTGGSRSRAFKKRA